MDHLNYGRSLAKHAKEMLYSGKFSGYYRSTLEGIINLHETSEKFLLPEGGRIFDDLGLRALDDSVELRLPFERICLEYHVSRIRGAGGRGLGRIVKEYAIN